MSFGEPGAGKLHAGFCFSETRGSKLISSRFLEDEDGPSDRRIEGGAETRASPRRNQHSAVRPFSAEYLSDEMSEARAHLNGGTFTAKRQAGADGEHSAEELYRN